MPRPHTQAKNIASEGLSQNYGRCFVRSFDHRPQLIPFSFFFFFFFSFFVGCGMSSLRKEKVACDWLTFGLPGRKRRPVRTGCDRFSGTTSGVASVGNMYSLRTLIAVSLVPVNPAFAGRNRGQCFSIACHLAFP